MTPMDAPDDEGDMRPSAESMFQQIDGDLVTAARQGQIPDSVGIILSKMLNFMKELHQGVYK